MNNYPVIYVIVVTYKGMKWYDRCFSSLRKSTMPVQVIVVDNTPGDDDANYIRENFPEIHIIKTEKNLGFGKANNLGMRYALDHGCDYVFLLNQDAWINPNCIELLFGVQRRCPAYGILSPMHFSEDGSSLNMLYEWSTNYTSRKMFEDLYIREFLSEVYETNYVNAAAWLISRNVLETVGGFDPLFLHYGEDDDYLSRAQYHNVKIGIVPSSKMTHAHHSYIDQLASEDQRHLQYLLLELKDLSKKDAISKKMIYFLRKCLINWFKGKKNEGTRNFRDFIFLFKNKKAIRKSRSQNKKCGRSWLE